MNEKELIEDIKKDVVEVVTPAITEAVFAKMQEELPLRKDIFGGGNSADAEAKQAKESAVEFIKSLTAGGSTSGTELVPTHISTEMVRVAEKNGLVRKYGRKWAMAGTKESVPTADSVTAYRVNEGAKITTSQPTTGGISLASKTVGVIVPFSRKLLKNANISVVDMITLLAGEALAKLEDKWALLGLASGEGVLQHASVPVVTMASGKTTYADATPEDLLDMISKVDDNISEDALRWVLSRSMLNAFRKQRAVVGSDKQGFLFQGFGSQIPATMWDIQYSLSPVMPKTSDSSQAGKKFMGLVDFSNVILGDDEKYQMEISEQATITDTDGSTLINLFEQNMVAIKVTGEIDIQLANPTKAFAALKTAAS